MKNHTFYILNLTVTEKSYFAEKGKLSDNQIEEEFAQGISFKKSDIEISLYKNRGNVRHIIDNLFSLPIVSSLIMDVIKEKAEGFVEFYPVKVNMPTDLKFYFMNILQNIDAFDYKLSKYDEYVKGLKVLKKIDKLVIKDKEVGNRHIFRLEGFKLEIVISQDLKNDLKKLNLEELEFIPLDEFKWDTTSFVW